MVAAELHPADEGDTTTLEKTLAAAKENLEAVDAAPTGEDPAECVTDKGYHSRSARRSTTAPGDADLRAQAERFCERWHGDGAARRAVTNNRTRLLSGVAKEAFKLRAEIVERSGTTSIAAACAGHGCAGASRAQAIPAPCRRPQSESPDAQTDRRRRGRPWRADMAYLRDCASWSRSGRSDGPHRLGMAKPPSSRYVSPSSETRSIAPFSTGCYNRTARCAGRQARPRARAYARPACVALERPYKSTGLRAAQAGKRDRAPELMRGQPAWRLNALINQPDCALRRPASATARPSLCEASLRGV